MKIFKAFCIIFILHLIPVAYIFCVASLSYEGVMGWILFLLLDFPLGWLIVFVEPIIRHPFNDFWNWQLAPALFFQIVGSINWLLIYLIFRGLFKMAEEFL